MIDRSFLINMGGGSRLFFLIFNAFVGILLAVLLSSFVSKAMGFSSVLVAGESLSFLKISQSLVTLCIFALPAFVTAFLFYERPITFLQLGNLPNIKISLLVIALIVVTQPLINLLSYINQLLMLPSVLAPLEHWMQSREAAANKVIEMFIADHTISGIVSNILVMAVLAGIAEEVFFRGAMQQFFYRIVSNKHLAIWVTAFIFSTIHFQFYGFIPRFLLGALLGYLFIWYGNLWFPIIAHIAHNALNVIMMEASYGTSTYESLQNIDIKNYWWFFAISLFLSVVALTVLHKKRFFVLEKTISHHES